MDDYSDIYQMLGAAAVRGRVLRRGLADFPNELLEKPLEALTDDELSSTLSFAQRYDVELYRFKRTHERLPRVHFALGALRSIYPNSICDIGSGRGVFLFPFLENFPNVTVESLDLLDYRVEFLNEISVGGISRLHARQADICQRPLDEKSVDVVTALEVLEHIPDVQSAVEAITAAARRFVIVTVPSKPDDNPEHIHLLTKIRLTELFQNVGCSKLSFGGAGSHLTLVANLS